MSRWSKFAYEYLNYNQRRLEEGKRPVTPSTFLSMRLRGAARKWKMRYQEALIHALTWPGSPYRAREVRSQGGKVAYVRI